MSTNSFKTYRPLGAHEIESIWNLGREERWEGREKKIEILKGDKGGGGVFF